MGNNLKTLNELKLTPQEFFRADNEYGDNLTAQIEKIKQEAIKWMNAKYEINSTIDFEDWTNFFNITEEDLKQQEGKE